MGNGQGSCSVSRPLLEKSRNLSNSSENNLLLELGPTKGNAVVSNSLNSYICCVSRGVTNQNKTFTNKTAVIRISAEPEPHWDPGFWLRKRNLQ
jgi:hypothetical protein